MSEVHSKCQENNKCNTRKRTLIFLRERENQKQGKAVKEISPKRNHEESFFLHIINTVGSH